MKDKPERYYELDKIIEEMLKKYIPDNDKSKELRVVLKDNLSSVQFSSPDGLMFWWNEVARNLQSYIGSPKYKWQVRLKEYFKSGKL